MERAVKLEEAFAELKTDMMEEIKDIDKKLILPAKLARDALKPMKKAIGKREDRKVQLALSLPIPSAHGSANRSITNVTKGAPKLSRRKRLARTGRIRHWRSTKPT